MSRGLLKKWGEPRSPDGAGGVQAPTSFLLLAVAWLGGVVALVFSIAASGPSALSAQETELGRVRGWLYQLDRIDPQAVAASGFDLVVVDYSVDGTRDGELSAADVRNMQRKPDGSRRPVIAYMSIGEAEDYRFYWDSHWLEQPPTWLDGENPDWPGNFKVRYWDPSWQRLIFGAAESYLDRILAAGFDGVYLDIIDAFEYYEETRPEAEREMVEFVRALSQYAKSRQTGGAGGSFYIIPQNGERLLAHDDYLEAIDGIAKEDLIWGYDGVEDYTPREEREFSQDFLRKAAAREKIVLTVDYVSEREAVQEVYRLSRDQDFVPYATVRDLDRITVNPGLDPVSVAVGGAEVENRLDRRRLPGQFFALTAPKGAVRSNLTADYWTENLDYTAEDLGLEQGDVGFRAPDFREVTFSLNLGYGITDRWEIGLGIPVVSGHLERNPGDGISGVDPTLDDTGIGNVRFYVAASGSSDGGDRNVLGVLEYGLATDSRGAPFGGGNGDLRLSITGERYWNRLGLIGSIAGTAFLEEDIGESDVVEEFTLGIGAELLETLYASLLVTREGDSVRPELAVEVLLGPASSLEAFVAHDVAGNADATSVGVALNIWFVGGGS